MKQDILIELRRISLLLSLKKEILTLDEFCAYAGISKNYAYQLTAAGKIKFYRPFGKMIYFKLEDVVEFLASNASSDVKYISSKANNYLLKQLNKRK